MMQQEASTPLRIAAIGYGDIAQRRHFPQLKELGGRVELVAIAGRDPGRLRACAERFGIPSSFTDPAKMLREIPIDAVMVLTPPDSHGGFAELVIQAGKHVMVEKPLVRTLDEALRLREAVRRQQSIKPITFFALPHVASAEHLLVDRLLRAGVIGEITHVECHRGHRGPSHASWFYEKHLAGGGVLLDLGIYQLSAVASLFGPATSMIACCSTRFDSRTMDDGTVVAPDVEDSAMLSLLLENKVAVSANANWNGCLSHHETRARTVVIGRQGILHFGVADGAVYVFRPDGEYRGLPDAAGNALFDGHACRTLRPEQTGGPNSLVGEFVSRIEAGDVGTRSLDIQVHVLEIITRAYETGGSDHRTTLSTRF